MSAACVGHRPAQSGAWAARLGLAASASGLRSLEPACVVRRAAQLCAGGQLPRRSPGTPGTWYFPWMARIIYSRPRFRPLLWWPRSGSAFASNWLLFKRQRHNEREMSGSGKRTSETVSGVRLQPAALSFGKHSPGPACGARLPPCAPSSGQRSPGAGVFLVRAASGGGCFHSVDPYTYSRPGFRPKLG